MLLSDLITVETRLERIAKQMKGKVPDAVLAEKALMERLREALEAETPLRDLPLAEEERQLVKGFQFLTLKPMILALNLGEKEIGEAEAIALTQRNTRRYAKRQWTWFKKEEGVVWFEVDPSREDCFGEPMAYVESHMFSGG